MKKAALNLETSEELPNQHAKLEALITQKEFCSSQEAAEVLGIALGTVQKMVERGALEAWKTGGGHRRIRVASLAQMLQAQRQPPKVASEAGPITLSINILMPDKTSGEALAQRIQSWGLPINTVVADNCIDASIAIGAQKPHILIISTGLGDYSVEQFIKHAVKNPACSECDFILVQRKGDSAVSRDASVNLAATFASAASSTELRAFVQGRLAQQIRLQRKKNTP